MEVPLNWCRRGNNGIETVHVCFSISFGGVKYGWLWFQSTDSQPAFPERQGAWRIIIILVALLACVALLEPLGFRISLFLFLLFLPLGLGERNWWVTLIFAVAGSFGIFHVFYYWLKVPLPMGMFGI